MLTVRDVALHWRLTPAAVRRKIHGGTLQASRIAREFRVAWTDVWANEAGPLPRGTLATRYEEPLLTKVDLAQRIAVSARTVERWIADGLPTRNVGTSVRIAPCDAEVWLAARFGLDPDLGPRRSVQGRGAAGRFARAGAQRSHSLDDTPPDADGRSPAVAHRTP